MQKFGEFVCKHKRIILIIMLILLIPSIIGMKATRINYDILVYLPDDIETIQGENILSEDFNMGAFSIILLEDMETKDILKLEDEIKQVDNVAKVISGADVLGTSIPVEMLPDEVKDELYKDNTTVREVKGRYESENVSKVISAFIIYDGTEFRVSVDVVSNRIDIKGRAS